MYMYMYIYIYMYMYMYIYMYIYIYIYIYILEGGPPCVRRTHSPSPILINTKVRWLRVTVQQTRPSQRFSNCFYVRLNYKLGEFHGIFQWFFGCALLRPMGDASIFAQMKGLMEIRNRGKFHQYSICGFLVTNVETFSNQQKIPFLDAFGWFFGHNPSKCCQILFKFGTITRTNILHHIYYGF